MKSFYLAVLFGLLLTSCASLGQPPEPYQLARDKIEIANYGIAIGRVTTNGITGIHWKYDGGGATFFSIRNVETKEEIPYTFANQFYFKLPPGTYEFYKKGTASGTPLIPAEDGLRFSIGKGELIYVGTVLCAFDKTDLKPHSVKIYGFAEYESRWSSKLIGVREPFYPFFSVDESDLIIAKFKTKYPQYSEINVINRIME